MRTARLLPRIALIALVPALLAIAGALRHVYSSGEAARYPTVGKQADGSYLLPTGQTIRPAGTLVPFLDRPVDMALSPDASTIALMTSDALYFYRTATGKLEGPALPLEYGFGGIVWSADSRTLYTAETVSVADKDKSSHAMGAVGVTQFAADGSHTSSKPMLFDLHSQILPNKKADGSKPSGLALSADGKTLYVSLFNNATVAKVDLTTYDPATGHAGYVELPVGSSPESLLVSHGDGRLYVADRGGKRPDAGDTVDEEDPVVVDPNTYKASTGMVTVLAPDSKASLRSLPVDLQPAALALAPNGLRLYVANANSDSVSIIATGTDDVLETIRTSPAPWGLSESSPNGLAVSPNGHTLYITLGGDNAVEVVTLDKAAGGAAGETQVAGLIPTAWFPNAITLSPNGKRLYVACSKGIGSLGPLTHYGDLFHTATTPQAGPSGLLPIKIAYPGHSVYKVVGMLNIIPAPSADELAADTAQVADNNHFSVMQQAVPGFDIRTLFGDASTSAAVNQAKINPPDPFWNRFKHVVLIIKENKTYDQIYGDIPVAPGHIGGDPNLVTFGEDITPNQHAIARQFGLFDNLYCAGEISADGHHWVNECFADDYDERAMNTYPRAYPCCGNDPLAFAGNKFLWQAAMEHGLTFHDYGEWEPLPSMARHDTKGYLDEPFTVTASQNEDVAHANRILADWKKFSERGGMPRLTYIWLPNDHTSGLRPGANSPFSDLADNDLAVGKLIDEISHSKRYWHDEPTAIFVVEDDAQGGLDHVDGHRTAALVISPYNKRSEVFSNFYNQPSMIRTMELMLGLPPLNQFDAAATPMRGVFQDALDTTPYELQANRIPLNTKNPPASAQKPALRPWALASMHLDFSAPDKADPERLTEIIWHAARGASAYPPTDASRG